MRHACHGAGERSGYEDGSGQREADGQRVPMQGIPVAAIPADENGNLLAAGGRTHRAPLCM